MMAFKILVTSQKGGVGKSTLSANLVAYLSRSMNLGVTLIDWDPHGSSSNWLKQAPDVGAVIKHLALPVDQGGNRPIFEARLQMRRAASECDILVCDLTWSDSLAGELMFEFDMVLVPTSVSEIELAATSGFLNRNRWVFDSASERRPMLVVCPTRVLNEQLNSDVFTRQRFPVSFMLAPPILEGDRLRLKLTQAPVALPGQAAILARGGDGASLARVELALPAGATMAEAVLQLPSEIRNQVVRLELEPEAGAAGVFLLDESFRRRPVGLAAAEDTGADAPLIGPLFYLLRALDPFAELRRGTPEALLARRLSVLILADRELADPKEREALEAWVRAGGTLIRFAGPRLAAKQDNLLPVPLRAGERQLGGMLTWEKPQTLAPFPDHSPFAGLTPTPEVTIERQVLAEPSPRLAERSWARLADGTPLVTAESRGAGRVVLFHITAQAEWSNLPLSGLFVEMLRRLVALSAGVAAGEADQALAPLETLDGFGRLGAPPAGAAPIAARGLDEARVAGCTGRTDRVMWARNPHIHRHFARRIIRYRAWVVVVGPVLRVETELGNIMNLVLGLDVAVFGDAEVYADAGLIDGLPDEPGIAEGFAGTIDRNRPHPGAISELLPLLPLGGVEIADPGRVAAHVADVDFGDARLAGQEVSTELREGVPVGGG